MTGFDGLWMVVWKRDEIRGITWLLIALSLFDLVHQQLELMSLLSEGLPGYSSTCCFVFSHRGNQCKCQRETWNH